jgi:hypothetical protein
LDGLQQDGIILEDQYRPSPRHELRLSSVVHRLDLFQLLADYRLDD